MGVSFYVWHYIKAPFDNKIIPSFWDQLAYFYCGIPPFTPSRQESFEMPIAYLITNLVLLFALGNTTVSVFEPYGYELFTRIPKRTVWWLAHCLLAVMAAVAEQVVITGTIAVLCLVVGGSFSICDYIGLAIPEIVSWPGDGYMQVVSLLLLPLLTTIALALFQIVFELVAGDTAGLLLTIVIDVNFKQTDLKINIVKTYQLEDDGIERLAPLPSSDQSLYIDYFQNVAYAVYSNLIEKQKDELVKQTIKPEK